MQQAGPDGFLSNGGDERTSTVTPLREEKYGSQQAGSTQAGKARNAVGNQYRVFRDRDPALGQVAWTVVLDPTTKRLGAVVSLIPL